jgi:glycosyltransferase involved in cell wall biosynthesis
MSMNRPCRKEFHEQHTAESSAAGPLRIAQAAPLYESVPPKLYGGTERVVAYLAEALARRGHDITLFASGDSTPGVKLQTGFPKALRLLGFDQLGPYCHLPMLSSIYENAACFDIIHSHVDCLAFPFARLASIPTVSTLHGRLDFEATMPVYEFYRDLPMVSISNAQRVPLAGMNMNWVGTVTHGLPEDLFHFIPTPGDYLAFLSRITGEKRPDLAIKVARRAGIPLRIAGKVDRADRDYFETMVKPLLSGPGVEFLGEINDRERQELLGGALALLFPIDWPEAFGLVMIEALACGTPVIARPCGSVAEVLRHGVTGLIASEIDDLVAAVHEVGRLSRHACRAEFETRFTADIMATNYERIYLRMLNKPWSISPQRRMQLRG